MKAICIEHYGSPDVLELKEVEKPTPKDDEVLIRVNAASLNAADWHIMRGEPFLFRLMIGLRKPKYRILGADIAGRIEAIGKDVREFKVGDEVFGDLSGSGFGGFAEHVCAPEKELSIKPSNINIEEAAATPMAAVTALLGLRDKGGIKAGQKVLINGSSGGVGTFAVQIAKSFGAEVTGVCSTKNIDIMHSIGADHVIDYTKEDFTNKGERYDLILAANGYHPILDYKRALSDKGNYVMSGGSGKQMFEAMFVAPWISMIGNKKMGNMLAKTSKKDLEFIKELIENGKVKPIIDRTYKLDEVPSAIRYLEEGHAKGKIVISI